MKAKNFLGKLNQIISHLQKNLSYTIVWNYTEYSQRSGNCKYYHKDDFPLQYAKDEMLDVSNGGVNFSDLDLGICDINKIINLGNAVSYNKTIQRLIIQDDETITNGNLENIKELSQAISQNQSIARLDLTNINLGGGNIDHIKVIFNSISSSSNFKNLSTLGLASNNLAGGKKMLRQFM